MNPLIMLAVGQNSDLRDRRYSPFISNTGRGYSSGENEAGTTYRRLITNAARGQGKNVTPKAYTVGAITMSAKGRFCCRSDLKALANGDSVF